MITDALKKAAHFRNLPDEALAGLAQGFEELRFDAGGVVFEMGERVGALYVVASGTILVFRGLLGEETRPVARLCAGDLLGTADLFDSDHHSETACALEESVLLCGDRAKLLRFLDHHPQVVLNLRLAAARDLTARAKLALTVAQRQAVRHRINRKVRIQPPHEGAVRATLVDLSPLGMALRGAPTSWQPEDIVAFRLEWGNRRLDMTGRIAWREGELLGLELRRPSVELRGEIRQMIEAMLSSPV